MHTSTHIAMSKATQAALDEVMLSFRQPLSPDQRVALANGSLSIKTTKYAGHHTFKGGRTIIRLAESFRRELGTVQAIFAQVPDQPCSFCCPNNHPRSSDSQFDCFNIAKSIWCTPCRGCHASSSWTGPCGLAWHRCPTHFARPSISSTSTQTVPARGRKRPAAVTSDVSATTLRRLEPDTPSRVCLAHA